MNIPSEISRRSFVKKAALATALLPTLFSCRQTGQLADNTVSRDAINSFKKKFQGKIFLAGDTEYEIKRRADAFNPELNLYPAIITSCKDEQDVLNCLEFAQRNHLEIAVRSGNHSFMGWGTVNKGMVIDLSQLKKSEIDAKNRTITISAGLTAAEVLAVTAPYGLAPVLGECGSVGSGLVLGGGLGWLSGKYGAACDNVINARVATKDIQIVQANSTVNDDLFWAIRGGGGNFGIATSFEYQLHPVNEIIGGRFSYPINKARIVLQFFNEFMAVAPDELQADCYVSDNNCWITWVYFGNPDEGEQLLNKFERAAKPERKAVKRRLFAGVYDMEEIVEATNYPYSSTKGFYIERLSDEVIDFVLDCVHSRLAASSVFFDFSHYMHGKVCHVSPDATAFFHRQPGVIHLVSKVSWQYPASAENCMKWHHKINEPLKAFSGGNIYANYMSDPGGASNIQSVFGSGLERLKQVKKKYDPDNIFHRNQNIIP